MEFKDLDSGFLGTFRDYNDHEVVRRISDPETGLIAFIAVHNTNLGPALGGCRIVPYESEKAAIEDVLRLSRGMSYKNALAGLPLGGGKSVILADPYKDKDKAMMKLMGQAIQTLEGRYVTAEDSGSSEEDMILMSSQTSYVGGLPPAKEGGLGGNPSPVTAYGVYSGLKAGVAKRYGSDSIEGKRISVQGLGAVGYDLCQYLHRDGAKLLVTDIRETIKDRILEALPGTEWVKNDDIFSVDADIFAPCAMGAQINDQTIPLLKVDIVAGAANNQLETRECGDTLAAKNILYAPDYVLNAGGVIAVAYEYFNRIGQNPFSCDLNRQTMMAHVEKIGTHMHEIFDLAEKTGIAPVRAADQLAQKLLLGEANPEGLSSMSQDDDKRAVR